MTVFAYQPALGRLAASREDFTRRLSLAREPCPDDSHGPSLLRLAGELAALGEPVRRLLRKEEIARARHPRTVMLLPGFATHPIRMRYMARQLERAGHTVKRWGLGFNLGPTPDNLAQLERRLSELAARHGEPVHLVGWSLGGLFARELAKRRPEAVAKVITMGSPFSGSLRANNAWRAYQFVTGHRVDNPPVDTDVAAKPPVETVALWSPRDGVVSPRSACGRAGERGRAGARRCPHRGVACDPQANAAVLRELERG
ncbi:MAG: esterase/lipase family protein [Tsuneonella sp.]